MRFAVEMRSIRSDGTESSHSGVVDAVSALNAVGRACLLFGVRSESLVYLRVEAQSGPKDAISSGPQ
mgnify:CR=1 FL=1